MRLLLIAPLFFSAQLAFASVPCDVELTPSINGLEQVSCTDCNCVVSAHAESIKELQKERAKTIKKNLAPILGFNLQNALNSLKDSSVILSLSNSDKLLDKATLSSCALDQISKISCAGAKNKSHLESLFGVSSINEVVNNLKKEFSSDDESVNACFSSAESKLIQTSSNVIANFSNLLEKLKGKEEKIASQIKEGKTLIEVLKEDGASFELSIIGKMVQNPVFKSILYNKNSLLELLKESQKFLSDPKELSNYIMFKAGKSLDQKLLNASVKQSCDELMKTVKTAICADDRVAQSYYPDESSPAPTLNDLTGFDPSIHDPSYDAEMAEMMDGDDKPLVESSYVGHLFWCSAKTCASKEKSDDCHKQVLSAEENQTFAGLLADTNVNREQANRRNEYRDNMKHLCSLAECKNKPQAEQLACVDKAKEAMGDSAGTSIAALDFMTNLETSQGSDYVPYTQLMANLEQSSLLEQAILGSKNTSTKSNESNVATAPSDANSQTVAKATRTSNDSPNPSAIASRIQSQSRQSATRPNSANDSKPSFSDRAFADFMSRIPKPAVSVGEPEAKPATTEATNSALAKASESIEKLRESYRKSALDRMDQMYDQIIKAGNNSAQASNNIIPQGVSVASNQVRASDAGQGDFNQQQQVDAQNKQLAQGFASAGARTQSAAVNGRGTAAVKPARVTTQNGQSVLNVGVDELPTISEQAVEGDGIDTAKPFQLAVKVAKDVFFVQVRPTVLNGRKMLEPMLDGLSPSLRAEVLKSPLFADYRKYLLKELVSH